jgi:micrococcal nuclease
MRNVLLIALLALSIPVQAANYGNKVVTVNRVYDGDTLNVSIPDWPGIVGDKILVRVIGIDTPEMKGQCDEEKRLSRIAKQWVIDAIRAGKVIELRNIKRDKYFRILADVYVDDKSLAAELIESGLAHAYDDGTKTAWCAP